MYSTSLYPPNSSRFSADVISAVVPQRSTPLSRAFDHNGMTARPLQDDMSFNHQQYFHAAPERYAVNPRPVTPASFVITQTQHATSPRKSPKHSASPQRNADPAVIAENLFNVRMAEYRERRRAIQKRYRQRFIEKADRLDEDVTRLRQEIQQLEQKQCDVTKGIVQKTTPWKVIAKYFRVFRHGYIAPATLRHEASCAHRRFLQDAMAPEVVFNGGRGVEALLEDWRLVSLHHEELNIHLVRMEAGSEGLVIAHVNANTTITANMVQTALLEGNEEGSLASKLVDQQLEVPMIFRFSWDSTMDHVVSVLYEADMLTPLFNLLGSFEDVARVLSSPLDFHHWSNCQSHT